MKNNHTTLQKDTVHLISHTHWDREWYFSFQHYRYRLVHLINQLLDWLSKHEEFKYFHLDGQCVAVEDYLEVEPEKKELLLRFIKEGRILIGPWYVLADEFLVSGESLIRNLLLGDRQCRKLGGKMKLGYLPDLFGHIGQMPQILKGFGMNEAIIWRGISDRGDELLPSEWIWKGTDGSEVLVLHLPDAYGYSNGSELPYDAASLSDQLRRLHKETKVYASTRHLLVMNGTDHQLAHLQIPGLIEQINAAFDDITVVHSTLPDYVESVKQSLMDTSLLPVYRGELRSTNHGKLGRFNFVLPNVLSSRIYLKQWNERVQTALERWAEPLAAIAAQCGAAYPETLLRTAWKYLLQNHPHDSICGCSIDEVHRQMVTRFEWAHDIAEQVIAESMYAISGKIGDERRLPGEIAVQVFNVLPFPATEAVETEIHFPADASFKDVELLDDNGREVPVKLLGIETKHITPDFIDQWPPSATYKTNIAKVCFLAEVIPALGYRTFYAKAVAKPNRQWTCFSEFRSEPAMENEYIEVRFHGNGSFNLLNKGTGEWHYGLHIFEDGADIGDGYTYSEPRNDQMYTTFGEKASFRLIEHSAIRTVYEISIDWSLPSQIEDGNQRRSAHYVACRLVSRIQLAAKSNRLDIETRFDNKAKDHRLRVLFATGLLVDLAAAAGSFAVDRRPIYVSQPDKSVWIEDEPTTFPHKGFVDLSTGQTGFAVISPGLMEYEISRTDERTIAVTLLRSVGYLGAGQRPLTIQSGAGPDMETPEAQCPGNHLFRYSIYVHEGDWETGNVYEQSQRAAVGLRTFQPRHKQSASELRPVHSFLRWDSNVVQFSAFKKAEESSNLILRMYNPSAHQESVCLTSAIIWKEAFIVDLKEERSASAVTVQKGDTTLLALSFEPGQIVTVELVPQVPN